MKHFPNNVRLVESVAELPALMNSSRLYLDFETTSESDHLSSTNPWHNCKMAGIGITVDDMPHSYYIPVGCRYTGNIGRNLPLERVCMWLMDVVQTSNLWINHNVKYDAHVFCNVTGSPDIKPQLIDTLVLAKLVDSDRVYKGGYGLSTLSKAWLNDDIDYLELALRPYLKTDAGQYYNRDYGNIPIDTIAPYGGQDCLTVRKLADYIKQHIPEESHEVMSTECQLTNVLFRMEKCGVSLYKSELNAHKLYSLDRLLKLEEELEKEVGYNFLPYSNKDVYKVLINTYGLPVLCYNEKGNPSFDKDALLEYYHYPGSPKKVVEGITKYRKLQNYFGLFLNTYLNLAVDYKCSTVSTLNGPSEYSYLHADINQSVRTGRMSCRSPNMQQLNKGAKALIHPEPGYMFISIDYSQIEFRIIAHYIQNKQAIQSYQKDPDTDFHSWVQSKLPGNPSRNRAKTINFQTSYGGGKRRMGECMDLMEDLRDKASSREHFLSMCRQRGSEIYNMYHSRFPELKMKSNEIADRARCTGYVTNIHGRRRHLAPKVAHIAFNSLCQGEAADIMKDRLVAIGQECEGTDVHPLLVVHDEILFTCPIEVGKDPRTIQRLVWCMESPRIQDKLDVPIRCSIGVSDKSWADCGNEEFSIPPQKKEYV